MSNYIIREFLPTVKESATLIPNLDEAIYLLNLEQSGKIQYYHKYVSVLTTTNELDVLHELQKYTKPRMSVLTVSGSGEHVIYPIAYGATNVTGFDVSYHSYLVTALKTIAVQLSSSSEEYNIFVKDFYNYGKARQKQLATIHNIVPVITGLQMINPVLANYFIGTIERGMDIFSTADTCDIPVITPEQFINLRKTLNGLTPFKWVDITSLSYQLNDAQFDLINYSNIFDFLEPNVQKNVLQNTKKHIKDGGILFFVVKPQIVQNVLKSCSEVFEPSKYTVNKMRYSNYFNRILVQNQTR